MFKNFYELYDAFAIYLTKSDENTTFNHKKRVGMSKLQSAESTTPLRELREEVKNNYFAGLYTVDVVCALVIFTSFLLLKKWLAERVNKSVSIV